MPRKLHIGGTQKSDGWEILNAQPGDCVDHVCDAINLSGFDDEIFSEIYASHILEHLDYTNDVSLALKEWHRVLKQDGTIYISVPDLDILAELFLEKEKFTVNQRFEIMRIIFGGHTDEYDFHKCGLNLEFLTVFLNDAGFSKVTKVNEFGLFDDMSKTTVGGKLISLNITAKK